VGLGLGVSLLMAAAIVGRVFCRLRNRNRNLNLNREGGKIDPDYDYQPETQPHELSSRLRRWILIAPWLALLAYCMKSGMVSGARLISPYYPLLLPLLIAGAGQTEIVRTRWWRAFVWIVLCVAFPVVILVPGRPLWPARTVLSKVAALKPGNRSISRALEVYTVYRERPDPMASLRELLPKGLPVVGFLGAADEIEISFWRPYGQRRVKHVQAAEPVADIRQRGIQYAAVSQACLTAAGMTLEEWRKRTGAELIATANITLTVAEGPRPWHLVRFP